MPNVIYSTEERLEMLRLYEQGLSYRRIVDCFAAGHPGRPIPSNGTVRRTALAYRKTGKITAVQKTLTYPTRKLSEEMRFAICVMAEEVPKKTCRQIAHELRLSGSTVWKVLRTEKVGSPKSQEPEKPLPSPAVDEKPIFSQIMIDRLDADESRLRRVCFSNECTILYATKSNKQYVRVCPWRIQHLLNNTVVEFQKLYVWTGIVGNKLFGPFFAEGTLDGEKYLKMLREEIIPALRASEGDSPVIWYKQDGVPVHYTPEVWIYLCEQFPGRWVGRYGPVEKPASTLDMSLLDLALGGRLKNVLYNGKKIENLAALQSKVKEIIGNMDPLTVCSTIRASYERSFKLQTQK